jgi:hypothetical protein
MSDMGTFRVDLEIENPLERGSRISLPSVRVDTGAELSWFPAQLLEQLGVDRETVHNAFFDRRFRP